MKDYLLERQLNRLEREANDDFLQIIEGGPEYYSTHELHLLLSRLESTKRSYQRKAQKQLFIGASASIWIFASIICSMLKFPILSYVFLALVPVSIIAFLLASLYAKRKFQVKNTFLVENIILQELERRRKDASIF